MTETTVTETYSYEKALAASQRVNWRVEDLIGGDKTLDFTKPFMPEQLARVTGIACLTPHEQMVLNQIRGHEYLYIFGLVEEFILPFVLDHARPNLQADDFETRALLQFASEEAKHIHLFKRFREEFVSAFGVECDVIGPPSAIAEAVMAHHPLAVALVILHIEWMTQRHYRESVEDNQELDPHFRSLLKHHWMEECQHAQLDTLIVKALAADMSPDEIDKGIEEYFEIGMLLDGGLKQQLEFDIDALEKALGRTFSASERQEIMSVQAQAVRWTFLGSGMTHEKFQETVDAIRPGARAKVEEVAPAFC